MVMIIMNIIIILICACGSCLQSNNEKLLENPYLQMRGIIQLSNDLGIS